MTDLGKFQLQDMEESARRTLQTAPEPWNSGHSKMTSGKGYTLVATFMVPTLDHHLRRCMPSVILELVRGYRVYKYLKAQHAVLVEECEMAIGPKQ